MWELGCLDAEAAREFRRRIGAQISSSGTSFVRASVEPRGELIAVLGRECVVPWAFAI